MLMQCRYECCRRWLTAAAFPFLIASACLAPNVTLAQEPVKIRLGTLAPQGSRYHRVLPEMGEKGRQPQGAGSTFTVSADAAPVGEADMVRRTRAGHLNAALVSGVSVREI